MAKTPRSVGDTLDCLDELAQDNKAVSVAQVLDAFGSRTFGPAIMVPALLELTPVGAIPGVPTFLAVVIALVAVQKLFGSEHVWLPGIIANRCVSAEKLEKGVRKLRPLARFMDRHFHRRFKALTYPPFSQIAAGIVILLCVSVPFLEVLPFASSVPMLAIAGFGLAVLARDGILMAVALLASVGAMGAMGHDYWDGGLSDTEEADGLVKQETVDAAKQSADEAGRKAEELGEAAQETARQAGEAAQETAEEAGKAAEETAKEAGEKAAETLDGE